MAQRKGNWKVKTREEKQQELDDLLEISNKKIEQYQSDPKDMIEFAKFMSKIHNYSPLNLSLIDEQFDGAIAVGSYARWKELGFQVQRGEKGIGIYAHAPVTLFVNKEGEEKSLREATAEEKAKVKNGTYPSRKVSSFKKGYVYDVSQTNATEEDLPKMFPNKIWNFKITGDTDLEQLESGVDGLADSLGISIKDMNDTILGELGNARGAYIQYGHGVEEISLNSRNSRTQNLTTSIHELAHKKLHNKSEKGSDYSTPIKEFQAEMTSFIVCNNYGIDTSEFTIPYIASWTKNNKRIEPKLFREVMQGVREASVEFMEKIDEVIIAERNAQKNSFTVETSKEVVPEELGFKNQTFSIDDFDKFTKGNFDNFNFENCVFDKLNMSDSSFQNATFSNCDFNFCDLSNSNLKGSIIDNSTFKSGQLKQSTLEESKISNTNFNRTNLSGIDVKSSELIEVSFNNISIGQSIKNLETVDIKLLNETKEESKKYAEKIYNQLYKENFNKEFDVKAVTLEYREHYDKTIGDPDRESHGSYLEAMVDYYQDKFGKDSIQLERRSYDVTATIGDNYVTYYRDTKQFDVCDIHGVTAHNTSTDKYDRLLLNRSEANCDYVEAFISESLKSIEQSHAHSQSYKESLRSVVMNESIYNLSETADLYYNLDAWHNELSSQCKIETVGSLHSCVSPEEFYNYHKQEIENLVTDFENGLNMDFRGTINSDVYPDKTSTLAYKLIATNLKNEIEGNSFEIPEHSVFSKNEVLIQSQSIEME